MSLPWSSQCIKYLMCFFNFVFVITGILILSVGAVMQASSRGYHPYAEPAFFSVPALFMAIGSIILVVSFFGCCGAFKENYCMTVTFCLFLVLIFVLEVGGGIAGYVLRDRIPDVLAQTMNSSFVQYNVDNTTRAEWDKMQINFECCGLNNGDDYANLPNQTNLRTVLPTSCCSTPELNVTSCISSSPTYHKQGCLIVFEDALVHIAGILGGVAVGLAIIQLLGIIFACNLAGSIRRNYETV